MKSGLWKKIGLSLVTAAIAFILPSGATAQAPQYAFRVSFRDKAGSPPVTASSSFLSSRSLARRNRLGVAVDETDRPVATAYIDSALQLTGGVLHLRSRWFNYAVLLLTDSSKIGLLASKPWVTGVQVVGYYSTGLHARPASPSDSNSGGPVPTGTTGSSAYYGNAWSQTNMVHGDVLHDAGFQGQGMLIAVMDEGFSELYSHPGFSGLRSSGRFVDSFQFVKRTSTGVASSSYHGMAVLSTMAGSISGSFVGSAPAAQYAVYVTEEGGREQPIELDNLVAATERADSIGADIVHASLGYNTFDYPLGADFTFSQFDGKTTLVARAANLAVSKGILFVTTSGNEGANSWMRLLTPGDADSALTVGSVDPNRVPAPNSGYGPNAAGRIKPDVAAQGQPAAVLDVNGTVGFSTGTSFAAPQIAGWAACLWQAHPNLTPGRIREAINRSADRYSNPGQQVGYGIPDFGKAHLSLGIPDLPAGGAPFTIGSNPFGSQISIFTQLTSSGLLNLTLVDVTGKQVWAKEEQVYSGTQALSWPTPANLPGGIYFLRLASGDVFQVFKVMHR